MVQGVGERTLDAYERHINAGGLEGGGRDAAVPPAGGAKLCPGRSPLALLGAQPLRTITACLLINSQAL